MIDVTGAVSVVGNLTLNAADTSATSITESTGILGVLGTTTITAAGNVALAPATSGLGNDFNTVVLNQAGSTGNIAISDINSLTISGAAGGNTTVTAGAANTNAVANTWGLTLGNLAVGGNFVGTAGSAGGVNSGTITQASGSSFHIENLASFTTSNGNIVLGNNGNSAGPVSLTAGTASITYVEDGTVKLQKVNNRGNASIKANFGSIIEDTTAGTNMTVNGTLTLNATNGSILLGNTTQTTATTGGNTVTVVATAPNGSVALTNNKDDYKLGNIVANSLTVSATAGNLTQSGTLNVFGTSSFRSSGNIALTANTNNFGPISINETAANVNVAITEAGTMNLRSVTMPGGGNGTFTATSVNGDIIDTGLGGVVPGGAIVAGVATTGTGVVTLTAANGNIVIDDPTSDFPTSSGVVVNAKNATLSVLGQGGYVLALGSANSTTVIPGNLTVSSALGDIGNAGNITVGGDAFFQTGTKNISLSQSGNSFGTLKFVGNQVSIQQTGNMQIVTGSQAIGPAQLATNSGNITIVTRPGASLVTFGNTVGLSASGNITLPKLISAVGTLTVNASGTKDLSALSISGDLSNKTPVNLGSGTYLAPQP